MKKHRIKLENLEVKSFQTIKKTDIKVKGGGSSPANTFCTCGCAPF